MWVKVIRTHLADSNESSIFRNASFLILCHRLGQWRRVFNEAAHLPLWQRTVNAVLQCHDILESCVCSLAEIWRECAGCRAHQQHSAAGGAVSVWI